MDDKPANAKGFSGWLEQLQAIHVQYYRQKPARNKRHPAISRSRHQPRHEPDK